MEALSTLLPFLFFVLTRSHDNSLNGESCEESSTSMSDEESGLENLIEDSESIGDQERKFW